MSTSISGHQGEMLLLSVVALRSCAQAAYQATWNWPLASMFQETAVV